MADKIVEIPGVGRVAFPESMSNEEIAQAIQRDILKQPPKEKPRSFGKELGRQAGLAGRQIIQGLNMVPGMLVDAAATTARHNIPINPTLDILNRSLKSVGVDISEGIDPRGTRAVLSEQLTRAGFPEPENAQERIVGDINEALVGGGSVTGVAQRVPGAVAQTIAAAPRLAAASEFMGAGAASGAREAGLPAWAQLGAGLLGGLTAPAAALAGPGLRRAVSGAGDVIQQFRGKRTDGMVEEFAGTELPRDAQRRLRSAERIGEPITPAEALGDPILAARQGALGTSDEGARQMVNFGNQRAAKQEQNIDRLLDSLSSGRSAAADVRTTAKRIVKEQQDALSAQAAPLYEEAYKVRLPKEARARLEADPVLVAAAKRIERDPVFQKALGDADRDSLKFWDFVKREVDDQGQQFRQAGARQKGGLVTDSTGVLKNVLDDLSPDYVAARAIYGEGAKPLQAIREGAVGRIAALSDDKLKNVSKILFDPRETDPKVLNQLRKQFLKEDPDAWKGIMRNEIERRLDATKGGKTGSNFYNTILAKDRDFRLFLNASRGMPEVQRTLMDMRRVWKDLINTESVKGAAGKAKSSLDVPRSSLEAAGNLIKNFAGGQADQAAVKLITDPKWSDELARIAKIKNQAAREKALINAIDQVSRSEAIAGAASVGTSAALAQ